MLKSHLMQLKSLRQLTFVSFAIVMIPLTILVAYSQVSLTHVAKIASVEAQESVTMVRSISKMESLALDVERLIKQYTIVKNDALSDLLDKTVNRFLDAQTYICERIDDQSNCEDLSARLVWIASASSDVDGLLLDAQLSEFKQNVMDLSTQVNAYQDARITSQQAYVNQIQQNQIWLTGLLLSVSVMLIIVGSKAILKPIEKVESVIKAIAGQEHSLPDVSLSGPRELIALEKKLHALAARLTQLEKLRTALLRHASHELKTPLASIKEGCSLLTEQVVGPLNNDQQEVLVLLNSSTDRLNLLIVELLDYNLLLQQADPDWEWIETQALIKGFVQENALALSQHDNKLNTKVEVSKVCADRQLYRRILDNLLSNAIAHGSRGRPIDIRIYQQDNMQVLDVANKGIKIPEELRANFFQPFSRGEAKRNDRVIGSGLGLSIVADCAQLMFGSAKIVDVDYADVCVRVVIPIKQGKI
jgi:two-component system sensor histidine kinase GlrK